MTTLCGKGTTFSTTKTVHQFLVEPCDYADQPEKSSSYLTIQATTDLL
jgi:hypothetical protein